MNRGDWRDGRRGVAAGGIPDGIERVAGESPEREGVRRQTAPPAEAQGSAPCRKAARFR